AYAHAVSEDLAPMRSLLKHSGKEKPTFTWNDQLQRAFEGSKQHVIDSVKEGIQAFNPKLLTCLQCDWSKDGIGFLLLQKHCGCDPPDPLDVSIKSCCESGWKLVYAGSRFTSAAESRYAPTEGEAAAVAWALKSSRLFILGCPRLLIITDHKPLLGILNNRELGSIDNPRLRRIKEHTLQYDFQIMYCPGKLHVGADALSRHPTKSVAAICSSESDICESQIGCIVDHAINSITSEVNYIEHAAPALTIDKVKLTCIQDREYVELHHLVSIGFPDARINVPDQAKHYWPLYQKKPFVDI
ncbi:MAG: ribonuclease H family protein, partial [Bacteroidota bacterium]